MSAPAYVPTQEYAVSSAMKGLTSGFGMEPGVPPSLWTPTNSNPVREGKDWASFWDGRPISLALFPRMRPICAAAAREMRLRVFSCGESAFPGLRICSRREGIRDSL